MFVGRKIMKLKKGLPQNHRVMTKFLNRASAAYVTCAQHMQKNLPLNSKVLKAFSCIDPIIRNHSAAVKGLK